MRVKLHIHRRAYKHKPKDSGRINNEITEAVSEVTPRELAKLVGQEGRTAVLATMNGKRSKNNMEQQQVLMLDFDNKDDNTKKKTTGIFYHSIEQTLEDEFIKENASFIYKTFSHTDTWERFRVVFVLDEPLVNNEEVKSAYQYLMDKYPNADKATKDSSRIFFGGTEYIEVNFENVLEKSIFPEIEEVEVKKRKPRKAKKTPVMSFDDFEEEIPTWKLIKAGEKSLVAQRWKKYGEGKSFQNETQSWNFYRSLDMAEMLGVKGNPFHNILEYDANPSASIWKPEDSDSYLYTCLNEQGKNGNNRSYDIIQIVQKLLDSSNIYAEQYLAETTGIDFNVSEEFVRIQAEAERFKAILLSDNFKEQHPEMWKIFGRYDYAVHVNAIIDIFKSQLYEYDGEVQCLTWMSVDNIAKRLNVSKMKASNLLNLITLVNITDKLDEDQIPESLLEILETNRTHVKDNDGKLVERKKERKYRSNVYKLGELIANFTNIEERCVVLTEKGFTMKGLSKEWVYRTFGEKEANRIYPQDKDRTVSKQSEDITMMIHKVVVEEIQEHGYVIVNELKDKLHRAYGSMNWTDYKYKQAEAELLDGYDLKKISLTNQLKDEYGITHLAPTARPKILIYD